MKQTDEEIAEAYIMGQRFTGMVRERQHESLLPWLEDVANSGISALMGFANGIKQDLAAELPTPSPYHGVTDRWKDR